MSPLSRIADACDAVNHWMGRLAWAVILALVLAQFTVVLLRYVFGTTVIVLQEGVIYLHAALLVFAAGYTLLHDGHVRVDVFYGQASARTQALVNLLGVVFLLVPTCMFIIWFSWGYVGRSWSILEGPLLPGGIRGVFLIKSLIPLFAVLFLIQGLSLALRSVMVLRGAAGEGAA